MLQRVMIDGIELPRLYIAENRDDANLAKAKGIPFIRWTQGQEALIRILLRPVLERMFPHINWYAVLGPRRKFKTKVEVYETKTNEQEQTELARQSDGDMDDDIKFDNIKHEEPEVADASSIDDDVAEEDGVLTELSSICADERLFLHGSEMRIKHKLDLADYIGDMSSYVNIEMLQRLRLMPAFIGNILDCVKINMTSGIYWSEGYNKRLGLPVGRFNSSRQLPNLIILDVSGSIPRGISATMISLIDTLRTQLTADLIITSTNSRFYSMGSKLPDPQNIRDMFGYGNESEDFFAILANNISGRHYGHVFSFGDNDTPEYYLKNGRRVFTSMEGTIVEHVHHYHTGLRSWYRRDDDSLRTGYAKWCHMLARQPMEECDTEWCKVISD